jgi:RsiW-degrading membrane proteinase PrsW (M82 family)
MGLLLSLVFGFLPMLVFAWIVYWLDRYEKEPKVLLGVVFLWGAVVAAGGAFLINTLLGIGVYLFTQSETATGLATGSVVAPVVEECLKGFAVLVVYLAFRQEFDSLLDGFVYAAITALGFAATENAFYIYQYGYQEDGLTGLFVLVFVRVILVGWQHPFYTAFTGFGLAAARLSPELPVKFIAPLGGLAAAVFTHAVHNTISSLVSGASGLVVGTFVDWTGWFFMALVVAWAIRRERNYLRSQLQEEVSLGLITPEQYRVACSAWAQSAARLDALFNGRYQNTRQFYQTCAELAHKKQQRLRLGEEGGNSAIIERLRAELLASGRSLR